MTSYTIHTDIKYEPLQVIDAGHLANSCPDKWWNQTLCKVNDCVARLGVFEGEFHWHRHEREDELFFVLEGTLMLDIDEENGSQPRTAALKPNQAMLVPRGVLHRTRAPSRTVVLMVEAATIVPIGD